jgi:hypothetical protein
MDWDNWQRKPIYLIDLTPESVFSGRVLREVKRWARPVAARVHETAQEEADRVDDAADELYKSAWDSLEYRMRSDNAGARNIAKKHIEHSDRYLLHKSEAQPSIGQSRMPPAPPGGWARHIAMDQGDADDLAHFLQMLEAQQQGLAAQQEAPPPPDYGAFAEREAALQQQVRAMGPTQPISHYQYEQRRPLPGARLGGSGPQRLSDMLRARGQAMPMFLEPIPTGK